MAKEFKSPKVGDQVNVVPSSGDKADKVVPAKVVEVSNDGRVITAHVVGDYKKPYVVKNAPFYPEESYAKKARNNTWQLAVLLLLALFLALAPAQAANPSTKSAVAGATNHVAWPGIRDGGIVLLSYDVTGDAASSALRGFIGSTGHTLASNAAANATNVALSSAAHGLVANQRIIVQTSEDARLVTVHSTNGATINFTNTIGIAITAGDLIWAVTTNTTTIASNTVRLAGSGIQAVPKRRPFALELTGTAATINSATVKYE